MQQKNKKTKNKIIAVCDKRHLGRKQKVKSFKISHHQTSQINLEI